MSDENILRLYQKLDEMSKDQSLQNERLARIEAKLDNNSERCLSRGSWMKSVDEKIDKLEESASSIGGAKGLLAILISIAAMIGAWINK